ncbi:hypothetical protein PSD17_13690 [Pseudonocardia sp. D17]|nr:hypothetical protein PSD17_13690 [Pseudonocardia sp. D17]
MPCGRRRWGRTSRAGPFGRPGLIGIGSSRSERCLASAPPGRFRPRRPRPEAADETVGGLRTDRHAVRSAAVAAVSAAPFRIVLRVAEDDGAVVARRALDA